MKKILAILMAGVLTATAFAGCGGGGESSNTNSGSSSNSGSNATGVNASTVDYAYFGDEDNIKLKVWAPDAAVNLVKQQIEDFKKAYSEKKFDITVVAQGESDAATQMLNDASAAADVFSFPSDQLNKLVDAGVIAPVAKGFTEYVTSENSEDTVKAGTSKDTLYAYPETNDNGYYMVYDNTVVTEEDAKTLEGTLAACQKAGKKFIFDAGDGFYACTFAFTAGAKIDGLEEDGITQKFVDYDEDEAVKTLQAFAKLIKEYKGTFTSLNVKNVASGFKNGTCGAGVDGSWDTKVNQDSLGEKFGAAKLPTINVDGEDKQLVSMFGYKYIGVNGSSKFPNSAQILALYLSGEECQKQRTEELGWGPSNKNVQQDKLVTESAVLNAIKDQSQNSCTQVNIASTFWTPMGNLGNKLVAEEWNPDDADATRKLLQDTITNIRDEG
ncbi:extracellular solute-binding protein [Ruminococcus sp.]|uniref:extracellular solute-binding protein n=1 Tax=Ruminococcus sp. TaxID=41978 RepID=UPI003F006D69